MSYAPIRASAARLLQRKGTTLTLTRVAGGTYDPVADAHTGRVASTFAMTGVVLPRTPRGPAAGTQTVGEGVDVYLTPVGAGGVPQDGDRITWAGRELVLTNVEPLDPDSSGAILYTAQAAR